MMVGAEGGYQIYSATLKKLTETHFMEKEAARCGSQITYVMAEADC